MKYAITSALYIFGVIMGLTALVLMLITLVPMAVSDALGNAPANVLEDDTAANVLRYAAMVCGGLWVTANIQHFAFAKFRSLVKPAKKGRSARKAAPRKQGEAEASSA